MENKIEITKPGIYEIRTGAALPLTEPVPIRIEGQIDSPLEFLTKRLSMLGIMECCLKVDKDEMEIELTIDEKNKYKGIISGWLELDKTFKKFEINTGKAWTTHELADFFKMNRTHFETNQKAMELVAQLKSFKAKVDKQIENIKDDRGNYRILRDQAIESNIPASFKLNIPIFKGFEKYEIEVEININSNDISCTLISPQANDIIEITKDTIIDGQVEKIKELVPALVIINC